jgi:hypothetical protein
MKEQIQKDMVLAMKEHDKKKLDVIKLLKAAIQMEEINNKKELTDDEIMNIIVKQVKMRKDAISDFEKASRKDLIDAYNAEIEVLNNYLPKQLSNEEILNIIDEAFNLVNPSSPSDMGKIMKEVSPKLKARADMGYVSKIIKDKLANL